MDTPDKEAPLDFIAEIEMLSNMIDDAHILVAQGQSIDMTNFEVLVAELCKALAEQPPADIDQVSRAIENLVTKLGGLSQALQSQVGQPN